MRRGRIRRLRDRVLLELRQSLHEETSPRKVASSFSLGTFITMLPTLGTGLILFFVLVYVFEWINKVALFASVIVFNPIVKWGVYASSISLGIFLLGPADGMSTLEVSRGTGTALLLRLWVGNLILAILATVIAYVVAYRVAIAYNRSQLGAVVDEKVDELVEEVVEADPATPAGGLHRDVDRGQ